MTSTRPSLESLDFLSGNIDTADLWSIQYAELLADARRDGDKVMATGLAERLKKQSAWMIGQLYQAGGRVPFVMEEGAPQ